MFLNYTVKSLSPLSIGKADNKTDPLINMSANDEIISALSGVVEVTTYNDNYGKSSGLVIVKSNGMKLMYYYVKEIAVSNGETITAGQVLGKPDGRSGNYFILVGVDSAGNKINFFDSAMNEQLNALINPALFTSANSANNNTGKKNFVLLGAGIIGLFFAGWGYSDMLGLTNLLSRGKK